MQQSLRRDRWSPSFLLIAMFIALFALSTSFTSFAQSDADGDGIPDSSDSCRNRGNEGGLGVDPDGCPYYDSDSDGIVDRNDACPRRGDEYGFGVGNDGCPLTAPPVNDNPDQPNDEPQSTQEPSNPQGTEEPQQTEEAFSTEEPIGRDDVRDADGDGIPDSEDDCPWQGDEGGLGVDETGCPYYDTDGDGIVDRDDACPWRGDEGGLGIDDTGCPYYDADWDGFYDRDDSCPWRADEYGFGIDNEGCPCEEDGCSDDDGDGVSNSDDLCPGFDDTIDVDEDGIPDGCDDLIDSDDDGFADDEDCDPNDPAINPDAVEIPGNDIDENCDGVDIVLGSGDVQVTLSWVGPADMDVHVIEPNGEHIRWNNRTSSTGGELDFDDIPLCGSGADTAHVENIFWQVGSSPEGTFQTYVDAFSTSCTSGVIPEWTLTVRVDGVIVLQETGNSDMGSTASASVTPFEFINVSP